MPLNVYGVEESEPVSELISEKVEAVEVNEDVELGENITADDLDISEQNVLPNNPFYFFKSGWRGIQSAFTFYPVKKAELKLRFADERLIEAKKMAETVDSDKSAEIVNKAIEKYEKEIEKVKNRVEKFEGIEAEKVEKFIERFSDHQIKQQKLIDRIENKLTEKGVAPEKIEAIIENKQRAIEHFANGVLSVVSPEVLREKLEKVMEEAQGSEFKHFKNLEILKNLEERVPEEAREALRKARENSEKKLNNILGDNKENRERFKDFIENLGGNALGKLKVIEELNIDNPNSDIKRTLEEIREKTLNKVRDNFNEIKSDDARDKFFKRLENLNEKDFNIIDKIEGRLGEEARERFRDAKEKVIENRNEIKERLNNGDLTNTDAIQNIKERAKEVKNNIRIDRKDILPKTIKKINDKRTLDQVKKLDLEQREKLDKAKNKIDIIKGVAGEQLQNTKDALIEKTGQVEDIINNAQ